MKNEIKEDDFEKLNYLLSKAFYYLNSEKLNEVALILMRNSKFEKYFIIQNINSDEFIGKYLLYDFAKQIEKLDFVVLMNWFKHLVEEYNTKEDSIVAKSKISAFKDGLLNVLISKSTDFTVVNLLEDIKARTDKNDKHLIDYKIRYAIKAISLNARETPSPNDFLESIKKHKRLIQTEDRLAELVYEALEQLQVDFKDETVPIGNAWGNLKNKRRIPKQEDEISNNIIKPYLKQYLKDKAIIVNREPQVNIKNSPKGKSADFFVEIIAIDNTGIKKQLTVIIEAKGCWHDEVQSSMESQLIKDYLQNSKSKNGIYLIYYVLGFPIDENCSKYKSAKKLGNLKRLMATKIITTNKQKK